MLENKIMELESEISKARIYNNKMVEKEANLMLAFLLELKEHRKAFGLDKILSEEELCP